MRRIQKGLVLTFVIIMHALVLVTLPVKQYIPVKPPVSIVEQQDENDWKFVVSNGNGLSCPEYYMGVGFKYDWSNIVTEVEPSSPAERAGIMIGDRMISDENLKIMEEGTHVMIKMSRNGQELDFPLTVSKICYEH